MKEILNKTKIYRKAEGLSQKSDLNLTRANIMLKNYFIEQ